MFRIKKLLFLVVFSFGAGLLSSAGAQEAVFEVAELNAGLGAPPDRVDRRTPRAAMASFIRAADDEDWAAAAHLLDLTDLPVDRQTTDGPALARQLYDVIDRKAVLDWSTLLDRPDALQATGGDAEAQAGEPRRSLLLRDLPLDPVPAAIRLNRLEPADTGDAVWVFSRETVGDVPALHRAYGPSDFERLLPEALRAKAFGGLRWWELIGLPLLAAAAFATGWAVHRTLRTLWRRAESKVSTDLLRAASMPLIITSVTGLVWAVTDSIFVFSGKIDVFLAPAVVIGFVTALLLLIVNSVEVLLDRLVSPADDVDLTSSGQEEARTLATRLNAGKRILIVAVFLVGAGIVLSSANLFESLGLSVLASAGALTIVLGFAARNILGNIMASLQIALNQSARVGDRIVYREELCHVERINMTFVQLRDWDGTRLVVPVEQFVSETFSNWTLKDPAMLRTLKLKLNPRADVERLRQAFNAVLEEVAATDIGDNLGDLAGSSVNVADQDVFGMEVWFSLPCTDPNTSWEVACTVRERLLARAARIEAEGDTPVFPEVAAGLD